MMVKGNWQTFRPGTSRIALTECFWNYVHTEDNVKIQILSLWHWLAAWKVAYNIYSYSSKSNLFQYFTVELVKRKFWNLVTILLHMLMKVRYSPRNWKKKFSSKEIIDSNYIFAKRPSEMAVWLILWHD